MQTQGLNLIIFGILYHNQTERCGNIIEIICKLRVISIIDGPAAMADISSSSAAIDSFVYIDIQESNTDGKYRWDR